MQLFLSGFVQKDNLVLLIKTLMYETYCSFSFSG